MVARDLSCAVRTAENILGGHLSAKSITRLTLAYGLGFLIDAGAAVTGMTLEKYIKEKALAARLAQEEWRRREHEYDQLQAALAPSRTDDQGGDRPSAQ